MTKWQSSVRRHHSLALESLSRTRVKGKIGGVARGGRETKGEIGKWKASAPTI